MSEEKHAEEELAFGEKLLGLQGFSAARARRYRVEIEKLLVHRISRFERWTIGVEAALLGAALIVGGIAMSAAKAHPEFEGLDEARLTISVTVVLTGLLFGGWLLWIAIQGGYRRRLGDGMGLAITLLFCGGWGYALIDMAWQTDDAVLRMKLLTAGGALFLLPAACIPLALLQRMHRQTQEKLLRIEYHLAELMEQNSSSPPT